MDDFLLGCDPDTLSIRAGITRSQFGEHSEALYLTSSFIAPNAAEAAKRFSGEAPGFIYSRFTNPTVSAFEERLAALEGAEFCVATASGMSAILSLCMGLLKAGDHIVAAQGMFGATQQLLGNILGKFGIETSWVQATDVEAFRAAVKPNTRLFFVETPSNPLTELVDIAAVSEVAHAAGAWLAVDNCFCSPALQQPIKLGADFVIHSATKFIDGQGRVLGGAVLGPKEPMQEVFRFLRTAGPSMSPFNAWVALGGIETLRLRVEAQSASALAIAQWLEKQPQVERVNYPWLASHPQHELAKRQQKAGGAVVSFEVKGGREAAWRVIDHCKLLSITANLGDTKTTITHPSTTTHGRVSPEAREAAGIREGLVRVAVGLEAVADIQADLLRGLQA
ncbi:MAG: O-succinylhomoserine sulfhydrylase [Moraxellaceae bacterium]|nr:O-succinylhomoserine sulfhydrylase [Moraxellaceae bacterium]